MRKYLIEIVCFVLFLAIAGSCYFHCTHNRAGLNSAVPVSAEGTDWILILQIVSGVIVAIIGAMPSIIKAWRERDYQKIETIAEDVSTKLDPLLTDEQKAKAERLRAVARTVVSK